jgi:hypothetical protein
MGGACSTHGRDEKCIHHLVGKPERMRPRGRLSRRCEYNNIMCLRETGWQGVCWMHQDQDMDQVGAVVNTVMYLGIP